MKKTILIIFIIATIFFVHGNPFATVILSDNFDSYDDLNCKDSAPGNWDSWSACYSDTAYGVTHHNVEIADGGKSGKGLHIWRHDSWTAQVSCAINTFDLGGYNEVYVGWSERIPSNMSYTGNGTYVKKFRFATTGGAVYFQWVYDFPNTYRIGNSSCAPAWYTLSASDYPKADGRWHDFIIYIKLDDNQAEFKMWDDDNMTEGKPVISLSGMCLGTVDSGKFRGSPHNTGFGFGNTSVSGFTPSGKWLDVAYDNFVFATTWQEAYNFLGDNSGPALSNAVITSDGQTLTISFNKAITQASGYNDSDWKVDCGVGRKDIPVSYLSGNGTLNHTYTISKKIYSHETCSVYFNGDTDSEEDSESNDVAETTLSIANNSKEISFANISNDRK